MTTRMYLEKLNTYLHKFPKEEKEDALSEIKQHIEDAITSGELEHVVLSRLGKPRVLANALLSEYYVERKSIYQAIPFLISVGWLGIFVVPFFSLISFWFGLTSVFAFIAGFARTFGADWIQMELPNGTVPTSWSIPMGILISLICAGIALGSWKILKLYSRYAASTYRRYIPRSRES